MMTGKGCLCCPDLVWTSLSMLFFTTLLHLTSAATPSAACTTDDDCSLNGKCVVASGSCDCYAPWGGSACGVLQFAAAPTVGAYGDGGANASNVTSWGGKAVYEAATATWHGFFTEIAPSTCGLSTWRTHSTVVHAVATKPSGPYKRSAVVLQHEAHNPAVLRLNATHYYIFHIGDGDSKKNSSNCPIQNPPAPHKMPPTKYPIHRSTTGPAGPFAPLQIPDGKNGFKGCNNPSPFQHPNGTLYLACTWSLRSAPRPEGPWSTEWTIAPKNAVGRKWGGRYWEDVFIYVDARGHWHVLAHTYINDVGPALSISGHGYSRDGHHWTYSETEPYSSAVKRVDGSEKTYSTMERPKFLFADPADPLRPTHLFNGASPVWDAGSTNPCGGCKLATCVKCKVTTGMDWTYTVVRPLMANS